MQILPSLFEITTNGLENREVEYWMRLAARYKSKIIFTFMAKMGLMRCGREVTGGVPGESRVVTGRGVWERRRSEGLGWRRW